MSNRADDSEIINFDVTQHIECLTGNGVSIDISCRPEDVDQVKEFIRKIYSVRTPETGYVVVGHGGYGRLSRFIIQQHKYAGGGYSGNGGFIEVLEIQNPPEGRCGTVIYKEESGKATFYEFESLDDALGAWKLSTYEFEKSKGFVRCVICGLLEPWFYAKGNQAINGDFAFPDYLNHNHSVYRTGRKVKLVTGNNCYKEKTIKVCWGTTKVKHDNRKYLVVQFNDGTIWNEYRHSGHKKILPLDEDDLLKEEIIDVVKKLLNGDEVDQINIFSEGRKIIIKSEEIKRSIEQCFTKGIQQTIDGGEIKEVTFVIESKNGIIVGNDECLIEEKK